MECAVPTYKQTKIEERREGKKYRGRSRLARIKQIMKRVGCKTCVVMKRKAERRASGKVLHTNPGTDDEKKKNYCATNLELLYCILNIKFIKKQYFFICT
jgi:hypothetical protein